MINTKFYSQIQMEDTKNIYEIANIILNGGLAIIPTETVYGLAADGLNAKAVSKIFIAKGRPQDNPLILHISDINMIYDIAQNIPPIAFKLAEKFWPGPFTMILEKKAVVPMITSGGLESIAIRMPAHPIALKIIEKCNKPLAAPSANISGKPSPTSFKHCKDDMNGKVDVIVDGGECTYGLESTVISLISDVPTLLRPGAITPDEIKSITGDLKIADAVTHELKKDEKVISPGLKYKHYSPDAKVYLVKGNLKAYKEFVENIDNKEQNICGLVFKGEGAFLDNISVIEYGDENKPIEQAQKLFFALRQFDEMKATKVFARMPSQDGIGLAVYNRLIRAAAFEIIDLEE